MSQEDFAAYATANLAWLLILGAFRAVVGEAALIGGAPSQEALQSVVRATVAMGLLGSSVVVGVSTTLQDPYRATLLALGMVTPIVLLLDSSRYLYFAAGRPHRALWIDLGWVGLQLTFIGVLFAVSDLTPHTLIALWGLSAVGGAVAVVRRARTARPRWLWIIDNRFLAWNYLGEWAIGMGTLHLALVALGLTAGGEALGAYRAAQVVFGPLGVLYGGALAVLVPFSMQLPPGRLRDLMLRCSGALVAIGVALTGLAAITPASIGSALLGDTWTAADPLMIPVGLTAAFGGAASGAVAGLRSLRAASTAFRLRLVLGPVAFGVPVLAGAIGGAQSFAWAGAALSAVAISLWWRAFWRMSKKHASDTGE